MRRFRWTSVAVVLIMTVWLVGDGLRATDIEKHICVNLSYSRCDDLGNADCGSGKKQGDACLYCDSSSTFSQNACVPTEDNKKCLGASSTPTACGNMFDAHCNDYKQCKKDNTIVKSQCSIYGGCTGTQ